MRRIISQRTKETKTSRLTDTQYITDYFRINVMKDINHRGLYFRITTRFWETAHLSLP